MSCLSEFYYTEVFYLLDLCLHKLIPIDVNAVVLGDFNTDIFDNVRTLEFIHFMFASGPMYTITTCMRKLKKWYGQNVYSFFFLF